MLKKCKLSGWRWKGNYSAIIEGQSKTETLIN